MNLKLITAPAAEPVTIADIKSHLRIDATTEDALLAGYIKSAREWCEGFQNRVFITQTWEWAIVGFPGGSFLELPKPPLQTITSIKYYDTADAESTVTSTDYYTDTYSDPGRVVLKYSKTWPSTALRTVNGVIIKFVAGYGGNPSDVPEKVKQAIKLIVGYLYENREAGNAKEMIESSFAVKSLLSMDRFIPI